MMLLRTQASVFTVPTLAPFFNVTVKNFPASVKNFPASVKNFPASVNNFLMSVKNFPAEGSY